MMTSVETPPLLAFTPDAGAPAEGEMRQPLQPSRRDGELTTSARVPSGRSRHAVAVDLDRLITSRMLIQANSGGGKSWALRYLIEQTHGRIQQIILDPEGEFASLREHFPYVLAGKEGDIAATPQSANLLCRRLVELEASAVIDIYDLKLAERRKFVRLFLEELISLPRALWHPLMLVLDEAHLYAPERGSGEAESTEAVIAACTLGRKRGYAPVLATQRIAKLHKDAAAELLNVLVGRTGLDVDVRRAGDILGFDKEQRQALKYLEPGVFFAFGPAISREVVQVRTGDVVTLHPAPGNIAPPAPPPPEQLRALLEQLRDLPAHAEEEARDLATAQQRIAELERQLKARPTQTKVEQVIKRVEVPIITEEQRLGLEAALVQLDGIAATIRAALSTRAPEQPASQPMAQRDGALRRKPRTPQRQQGSTTGSTTRSRRVAPGPTLAPGDEIAETLAIPAIAAKLAQARKLVEPSARSYILSTVRTLWSRTLRPEDIAEGRGAASPRTISRRRAVCKALQTVGLALDKGEAGYTVNHAEIDRLRELARTVQG